MLIPGPEVLTSEYVTVLREMGRDPRTRSSIRSALRDLNDDAFFETVMPMPDKWRSDDCGLFCADRRVRRAEYAKRLEDAIADWCNQSARRDYRSLDGETMLRVQDWTQRQLLAEIASWLALHPEVEYDDG